jgi:predicted Rossmann-fold nucleotide-binding protein
VFTSSRRIVIGAIGGDKQPDTFDFQLGGAVARAGCILLTGGHPSSCAEVKNAAMQGAILEEAGGQAVVARLIGVIPSPPPADWRGPPPHRLSVLGSSPEPRKLFLDSEQSHNLRNVINGVTPDVVVAFGGGAGTLSEIAFARAAGRIIFFHKALERLRRNFEKYFGAGASKAYKLTYLSEPLLAYPKIGGKSRTVSELLLLLTQVLHREQDTPDDPDALVSRCIAATTQSAGSTGFPGISHNPTSKERFEQLVQEMSE